MATTASRFFGKVFLQMATFAVHGCMSLVQSQACDAVVERSDLPSSVARDAIAGETFVITPVFMASGTCQRRVKAPKIKSRLA
jgi:hypothetical protein